MEAWERPSQSGCLTRLTRQLAMRGGRGVAAGIGLLLVSVACPVFAAPALAGGTVPACYGDCNEDGQVTIDENLRMVGIILGTLPLESCPVLTAPPNIQDVILAVNAALSGCPPPPTPTPVPTRTPMLAPSPVVFELAEGSRIVYSAPPMPQIVEPLLGRLAIDFREYVPQFLVYDVTALEFHSPGFSVEPQSASDVGAVFVSVECPLSASIDVRVFINRSPLILSSVVAVPGCAYPPDLPAIDTLEFCNPRGDPQLCEAIRAGTQAGYSLLIVPNHE